MDTLTQKVLIGGSWRDSDATGTFHAINPGTGEALGHVYPVCSRSTSKRLCRRGADAATALENIDREQIARSWTGMPIASTTPPPALAAMASLETALPVSPRLADVELPRTTNQLRRAAAACRDGGWWSADHRYGAQYPLALRTARRAGDRLRPQQLPARLQRHLRRRLRRRHRCRQPDHRQGALEPSAHHTAVGRGRGRGRRRGGPAAATRTDDLSHLARRRRLDGLASGGRGHRLHWIALGGAWCSRRPPTRQASRSTWSSAASTRCSCFRGRCASAAQRWRRSSMDRHCSASVSSAPTRASS